MNIGLTIKRLRKEKNISQNQLSQRLCVTPQAISKWENGVNTPDISLLPQIAEALGVSIDFLFDYSDKKRIKKIQTNIENKNFAGIDEFAQAVSFIENELAKKPDDAEYNLVLGNLLLYYAEELEKKAVRCAKTVIDKSGQNDAALNIIQSGSHGFSFDWKRNNRYRLINYYETLINEGIATPDTYSFLIENLLLEREYDKALAFIKKAKNILPVPKSALYNILLDTIKNNKTDYSEIISIGLNSGFEENYIIGSFLASRNEYSAAIACWQRAFDKQEGRKFIDPLEQMSECYILLKKYADAININELIIEVLHTDWQVDSSKEIDEIKETIKALKLLIK